MLSPVGRTDHKLAPLRSCRCDSPHPPLRGTRSRQTAQLLAQGAAVEAGEITSLVRHVKVAPHRAGLQRAPPSALAWLSYRSQHWRCVQRRMNQPNGAPVDGAALLLGGKEGAPPRTSIAGR